MPETAALTGISEMLEKAELQGMAGLQALEFTVEYTWDIVQPFIIIIHSSIPGEE